jgi:hypothetical protein
MHNLQQLYFFTNNREKIAAAATEGEKKLK